MSHRLLAAMGGLTIAALAGAGVMMAPSFVAGQANNSKTVSAATSNSSWKMPRTPDGQPELLGYWTNNTYTPLERANNVNKEFFTKEEALADAKRRIAQEEQQTAPGTTADVHYDFTQFGLDKGEGTRVENLRTSLIIDPPDGKLPTRSAEFTARVNARRTPRAPGGQYDTVKNIPIGSRCVIGGVGQPMPMFPEGYNSNYQIAQGPGYMMILYENIGDVRIISMDGRPAPPKEVTQWMGISRGHWDGDTLIVETTNFNERLEGRNAAIQGVSADFKLIERFKRTGPDTMMYEATINDPSSYARPWTAQVPFARMQGPIFEPACHEGNYGIANTLAGARLEEAKGITAPAAPAGGAPRGAGGGARGAGGAGGAGGPRGGGARGAGGGGAARGGNPGGNQ